ncbi:MAG: DUF433 domain-containing protein [Pirellulales bacterium]|nr:DUF433 domain-containing protein [Pirellulales bacterium]
MSLDRITFDEQIMGGRACVRGMRIPVSVVLKLLAGGVTVEGILADYPDLEREDVEQCIQYVAILADEQLTAWAYEVAARYGRLAAGDKSPMLPGLRRRASARARSCPTSGRCDPTPCGG